MIGLHSALIADVLAKRVDRRDSMAVVANSRVILRTAEIEHRVLGSRTPEHGPLWLLPPVDASGEVTSAAPGALAEGKVA